MNEIDTLDFEQIVSEHIQETVYIIDANTYDLLNVNSALLKKLGSKLDYSNKKCYEFIYKTDKPCPFCKKTQLQLNQSLDWYKQNTKHNTTHLVRNKLIDVDGKLLFIQSSFPITKQVNKINVLNAKATEDNIVIECAKTLANKDDLEKSIDNLLQLICEFKDADCSFLFERNYSIHQSKLSHIYKSSTANLKEFTEIIINFDANSKWSIELNKKDYIYITLDDLDSEFNDYYKIFILTKEFENVLIIPIKLNGVVTAFIALNNLKNFENIPENFNTFCTIAMFITNSLFVKHNQEELEGMVITLQSEVGFNEVMMRCIRVLLDCKDFDSTIVTLLDLLNDYFYASKVSVFRINDENSWIDASKTSRLNDDTLPIVNDWYDTYCDNNIAYIHDLSHFDESCFQHPSLLLDDVSSFAITPITKSGATIGFLRVDNPKANVDELHLLNTITLLVSNHIDKVNMTAQLERLSYSDDLTSLYNRNYFNGYCDKLNASGCRNIGVIFADVNGLKLVNDNLGHEYGDKLISCCASILKQSIDGVLFRLGGDEFVVFCEGILECEFDDLLVKLENTLSEYDEIHISIGSKWCDVIDDIEVIVKQADKNMYHNKRQYYSDKKLDTRSKEEQLESLRISINNYS